MALKESKKNRACADFLLRTFRGAVYYKIADKFTAGIPDSIFTWGTDTSWLEFKLLDHNQNVHEELDSVQLVELCKLERQGGRAWVIAFRRPNRSQGPRTSIYRPSALLPRGTQPSLPPMHGPCTHEGVHQDLIDYGVAEFPGFDYLAVAALINQTHRRK